MESIKYDQVNDQYVKDLLEFGFDEYNTRLALQISMNDKEQAIELLCSGGADTESLEALALSGGAKISVDGENQQKEGPNTT